MSAGFNAISSASILKGGDNQRLTGTHVAIEMRGASEFRGTMRTELRLGENGYIALVRAHLGDGTVLSVFDDSPTMRYRDRRSGGICATTGGRGGPTGHVRERGV